MGQREPWVYKTQGFSFYSEVRAIAEEKNFYNPLEIIKFEKISDDIHHMGNKLMIRICANLARVNNGTRYYFYKEYEYNINHYQRVSVKRGFDYYVSIEEVVKPTNGRNKIFIRIGPSEFIGFFEMIKESTKWFTGKKIYAKKGGELVFSTPTIPSKSLSELPMGITLTLAPAILDNGREQKPGVQIIVDTGKDIVDFYMTVDNLFGVYGALINYNMFMSAQTMVSSLGIPLGTNRVDLSDSDNSNPLPQQAPTKRDTSSISGRVIGGVRKIDDLEV